MGTETKSNSYTGQISTTGGNPKVMKDSLSLVHQTQTQTQSQLNNQQLNQINLISNSYQTEIENAIGKNSVEIENHRPKSTPTEAEVAKVDQITKEEATIVPYVPIFVQEADVLQGAKDILKAIRPNWDLAQVEFKKFTDGITNKLVGCFYNGSSTTTTTITNNSKSISSDNGEESHLSNNVESISEELETTVIGENHTTFVQHTDNVVLVRVYGNKTDLLIDRKAETQNFLLLHGYGLAPNLYATFKNGLVYEYVPGVTLNTESVLCPDIWPLVARRMAEMHRVVQKTETRTGCTTGMNGDGGGGAGGIRPLPMLWKKTQSFLDLVPERFSDAEKHKRVKGTFLPICRLREEFTNLYKYLEALESPIVFCHNDLLLGNVIYTKSKSTVNFIDYEYADYNFQAFDIGNHFAEMCGIDEVDYSRYPGRDFQLEWLRVYLENYLQRSDIAEMEVERLYVQVNQFALAAHIFWTVWSLLQAEHSTIDFDYVDYAFLRYNEYLARKEEFLSLTLTQTSATPPATSSPVPFGNNK